MKRLIYFLILLTLPAFGMSAQFDLISTHETWVNETYAHPEKMDRQQLLTECRRILVSNLQESKCRDVVSEASEHIPSLKDYLAWQKSGRPDTLCTRVNTALRDIADYADREWPRSRFAAECRTVYLTSAGNISDTSEEWEKLIGDFSKTTQSGKSREDKGLLAMMKCIAFCQKTVRRQYDDPAEYGEIFDIEKEALEAYPPQSADKSMLRAELYYWLGELKSLPYNDFVAGVLNSAADFNSGTEFELVGSQGRYPSNSPYYFRKAAEIASENLNPGHPLAMEFKRSELAFHANNYPFGDETIDRLKKDFDYIRYYYPSNSLETAVARILWCIRCLQNGIPTTDDIFLSGAADTLETSLGVTNSIYHQHLWQIAMTMLFINPDNRTWLDRMMYSFERSGIDEKSDRMAYFMTLMNNALYQVNPTSAKEKIDILYDDYLKNHNASVVSILTGRLLADFYVNQALDKNRGTALLMKVWDDQSELYGDSKFTNPAWWETMHEMAYASVTSGNPESMSIYTKTIDLLEHYDFPSKNMVKFYMLSGLAWQKSNKFSMNGEAAELYRQSYELLNGKSPDALIYTLSNIALLSQSDGKGKDQTMPFIMEAEKVFDSSRKKEINTTSLKNLSNYYYNEGEFKKSLDWNKRQLALYEDRIGKSSFSIEYLTIRRDIADCCERLGDLNEARRILGEDADMMTEAFGITPSPTLLDCLWMEYYALRSDNAADFVTLMPKLNNIGTVTNALLQSSQGNNELRYTYLTRALSEVIYILSYNWDKSFVDNAPAEAKSAIDAQISQLSTLVEIAVSLRDEIKKQKVNYLSDNDYRGLVTSLSTYYNTVKGDHSKSIELQAELLGNSITENNLNDYINMTWSCVNNSETDRARTYMDMIENSLDDMKVVSAGVHDNIDNFRITDYINTGQYAKALPYARRYFERHKQILDGNFQLMTNLEQENYMATNGDPAKTLAVLAEYLPEEIASEAYDAIIYRTGMQLRSQRATKEAIELSDDPATRLMLDSVASLRTAINNIGSSTFGMSQEDFNARTMQLAELQHKKNRMEQKLLAGTRHLRQGTLADVTWQQIRDRLRTGQAAVEFLFSDRHVMALVIKPGIKAPRPVMLALSEDLVATIKKAGNRNSASLARYLYSNTDTSLYDMLWKPLETELSEVKTVFYSLPGILSNLAFNAFPTPDGRTLFDSYELVQLTTTAQLVFDRPIKKPETIAMMGDILYDESQTPKSPEDPGSRDIDDDFDFEDNDAEGRALTKAHFRHLPFTANEIDEISSMFRDKDVDCERRLKATEWRLRDMTGKKPDILHLATHGYYISPDRDIDRYPYLKAKGGGNMMRSGIALAGAEKAWRGISDLDDDHDGILTAAEVSELDLRNTQLVALSACETALGDYSFEGIFGLQRGFKQAGAQSLLVSLWSVNDRSTALFMRTFYKSLREGNHRYHAWRDAVASVRAEYPDPYHWASFILLDAQ